MTSSRFELGNLIEGFRLSCQTENKSSKTVEWYISFLNRFRWFLLREHISTHVRKVLGPVAYPDKVFFVKDVPKTRYGKIMRRVIKAKALGKETGDISALSNPEAVSGIPLIN